MHSLIDQSRNALACKTAINADGFGVAWYGEREAPCIYKDIRPAWSDANLRQIAHHVRARLFLAHVRASTGTATTQDNCHPFAVGPWSFMHNGQIGGYERIRKKLDAEIPDALYRHRVGNTDSEALFLIALSQGLQDDPVGGMVRAVAKAQRLAEQAGGLPAMRFAACWSNGHEIFAARYASDHLAPTLFYRTFDDGICIVSEPFDEVRDAWCEVPPGTAIRVTATGVDMLGLDLGLCPA
ncbi:class II glutamine amidotransferase [Roseibium aquae]|uniref:Class II glutamine amidotransferase n=1 Tax=Roseibium aquae TaxID=1323746 RepID=A0A916TM82_9HYPH|nr:class II glutamine amidotransferase [Roseibium aquae]